MTTPMLGSNQTPLSASSLSEAASASDPCSSCVHPAIAVRFIDSGLCAWTSVRSPCAFASPHAASICSCDMVGAPPSRMLAEAKILIRSAPSAFFFRMSARMSSTVILGLETCPSEVSSRGPGRTPRAMASRNGLSDVAPTLWTVVNPAISVTYAFSAP
jgi:hypothetical protein